MQPMQRLIGGDQHERVGGISGQTVGDVQQSPERRADLAQRSTEQCITVLCDDEALPRNCARGLHHPGGG